MSTRMPAPRSAPSGSNDEQDDERFASFAIRTVALYPILWLVGLAPAFWVLIGIAGVRSLARSRVSLDARLILLVPIFLLLSLPVGLIRFGADPGRVLSMAANVLVWVGVAAMVNSISGRPAFRTRLMRALLSVGIAQGVLIAISARIYPSELPVPVLGPLFANAPTGISAFTTNGLYYLDWLNGAAFRSQGIMGNATWNGALGAVTVLLGVVGLVQWRGRWRVLSAVAVAAGLLSLQTSLSRSTMIAIAAAGLSAAWMVLKARRPSTWAWTTGVLAIVAVWVLVFDLGPLVQQFNSINSERAGSALSRGAIYATTIQYVQESPLPALGYGLKPKEDGLVASVATHSTYLGIIFRAGLLGAAALALVYIRGFVGAVRRASPLSTALIIFITLWCIFEDLDGGHLLPVALVLVFGGGPVLIGSKTLETSSSAAHGHPQAADGY